MSVAHHARGVPLTFNPGIIEQDIMTSEKSKDEYYREAAQYLNTGERVGADSGERVGGMLAFLTRGALKCSLCQTNILMKDLTGIHQLSTRSMDDAMRSFDGVLAEKPTNLIALLGKVDDIADPRGWETNHNHRREFYITGGTTRRL